MSQEHGDSQTEAAAISRFKAILSEIPTPEVSRLKELINDGTARVIVDDDLQAEVNGKKSIVTTVLGSIKIGVAHAIVAVNAEAFLSKSPYRLRDSIEDSFRKFEFTRRTVESMGTEIKPLEDDDMDKFLTGLKKGGDRVIEIF